MAYFRSLENQFFPLLDTLIITGIKKSASSPCIYWVCRTFLLRIGVFFYVFVFFREYFYMFFVFSFFFIKFIYYSTTREKFKTP